MPHMLPEIDRMKAWRVETNYGTETVPADLCDGTREALEMFLEGKQTDEDAELVEGWFCRLSAPGYMDQTEWSGPYSTEQEAREALSEMFDVDADTGEDLTD